MTISPGSPFWTLWKLAPAGTTAEPTPLYFVEDGQPFTDEILKAKRFDNEQEAALKADVLSSEISPLRVSMTKGSNNGMAYRST